MAKKFRSNTGGNVRVALLSGHIALIGPEWRELPEFMWGEAYRLGCVSDDMTGVAEAPPPTPPPTGAGDSDEAKQKAAVKAAAIQLLKDAKPGDLTAGGVPNATRLSQIVGFNVTSDLRDEVMIEIEAENDA